VTQKSRGLMGREDWSRIPGFPRYEVSNYGRIFNRVHQMFMKPSAANAQGLLKISLIDENEIRRSCSLHQLVAQAFVEPPNRRSDHVIHLDGDLSNVAASNLAWRTRRQAFLYSKQMRTPPHPHWQTLKIRNVDTGVEYNNVVHCGIVEGLIFHEIMESALGYISRPPERRPVYPHGFTYQII
jgi:hypothetical protein